MGNPSRVRVVGPLAPYAAGFRAEIEAQGYRRGPVCDQLRLMAHVSRWLVGQSLDVGDLTPERVKEFLVARRAAGYTLWLSNKGVAPLLSHLRSVRAVPMPVPPRRRRSRMCWPSFVAICSKSAGSLRHPPTATCTWRVCSSPSAATPPGFVSMAWERQTWCPLSQAVPPAQPLLHRVRVAFVPALLPPAGADARPLAEPFRLRPTGAWRLYRKPWSTTTCRRYSKAVIGAPPSAEETSPC